MYIPTNLRALSIMGKGVEKCVVCGEFAYNPVYDSGYRLCRKCAKKEVKI